MKLRYHISKGLGKVPTSTELFSPTLRKVFDLSEIGHHQYGLSERTQPNLRQWTAKAATVICHVKDWSAMDFLSGYEFRQVTEYTARHFLVIGNARNGFRQCPTVYEKTHSRENKSERSILWRGLREQEVRFGICNHCKYSI